MYTVGSLMYPKKEGMHASYLVNNTLTEILFESDCQSFMIVLSFTQSSTYILMGLTTLVLLLLLLL